MRRLLFFLVISLFLSFLLCCAYDGYLRGGSDSGGGGYSPEGSSSGSNDDGNQYELKPGQLTAGEWSDIKNYDFYLNLFNVNESLNINEDQRSRNFAVYKNYFGFETRFMITVNVDNQGQPVKDAVVELYDAEEPLELLFTARTNVLGSAYLFPEYDLTDNSIIVRAVSGGNENSMTFVYDADNIQITLDGSAAPQSILDLMFVIDTTGSMGDELNYLKSEIANVIDGISSSNANYDIRLALLFYRDIGDDYVTRYFDFTGNINTQQENLSKQFAAGGGDYPEAVDIALSEAVEKDWSAGSAVRLIFHVCDAPPHNGQENKTVFYNAVRTAAEKGIRIIPVASSGVDLNTEFLLRQEALMTGGTYIFLTDDSGIGYEHLKPTIGEYVVEYLNACMIRVINEYITGEETEPVPYYNAQ
ncbi:MAG: VWA domain-containing protein [Treponema sp.]|nr:VWA domain-containing protein [Treponema sp.]